MEKSYQEVFLLLLSLIIVIVLDSVLCNQTDRRMDGMVFLDLKIYVLFLRSEKNKCTIR